MKATLKELTIGRDGKQNITVTTETDFRQAFDELAGGAVEVEIRRYRPQRTLSANAYAWVLIGKIAAKLSRPTSEVYREVIRDIGGVSEVICIKTGAVPAMKRIWESRGLGWQAEALDSRLPGCTNLVLFYGSSVYDSKQMSLLIDHLIQDAEALGIPTLTRGELERMLQNSKERNQSCLTEC